MAYLCDRDMVQCQNNIQRDMGFTDAANRHLPRYGLKFIQNNRCSGNAGVWMNYANEGTLCHEKIMHTGLSCLQHERYRLCLTVSVGKMFIGYGERAQGACSESEEEDDDGFVLAGVCGEEVADEIVGQ